jgi:hypothetical protein
MASWRVSNDASIYAAFDWRVPSTLCQPFLGSVLVLHFLTAKRRTVKNKDLNNHRITTE